MRYAGCPPLRICHGSPDDTRELLREGEENTKRILTVLPENYLLCAHTHIQQAWEYGGKHIINPGSVGVPWYYDGRAQFAILRGDKTGWESELLRVSYDVGQVMRECEESGLNAMAPSWARMTRETIKTGVDKSSAVLRRVEAICEGTSVWPDFPEAAWEQAIREIWPEMGEMV